VYRAVALSNVNSAYTESSPIDVQFKKIKYRYEVSVDVFVAVEKRALFIGVQNTRDDGGVKKSLRVIAKQPHVILLHSWIAHIA